jgi:plasmid stability protein
MAQPLVLNLSDETLAALKAAADAAGRSVEQFAAEQLAAQLSSFGVREDAARFDDDSDVPDLRTPEARAFQQAAARDALAEYDRTGEYVTLEDALAEFHDRLEERLAAKR